MILVTGGCGYIGSHCVLKFLNEHFDCVIFDNLSNSNVNTVEKLRNYGNVEFFEGDLRNKNDIEKCFQKYKINGILHFAGVILVGESVENPYKYYENNVFGTLNLYETAKNYGVKNIIFSSSCAVYGEPEYTPIDENHKLKPINPYGQSKLMAEKIAEDYDRAFDIKTIKLRYFNVAGCETFLGENHNPETHLIPNIIKSILNGKTTFELYGDDYNTPDGTCIRDYVNVKDLATAHILAYKYVMKNKKSDTFNIGTEKGYSVKEILEKTEIITNKKVNIKIQPKRDGDAEVLLANSKKAKEILGFVPQETLENSIKTAYEYEQIKRKVTIQ